MSTTYPNAIRIADMPDLGEVTDATSLVGERAGSGRFSAPALRSYLLEAPMSGAIGRNLLHNSMFQIAQRGAGPFTTNVYSLDRWLVQVSLDTINIAQDTVTDGQRTQIGDEEASRVLANNNFVGNGGAGAYSIVTQKIENVRRLAGKTVTVSFWAITGGTALKLGVNLYQHFGTGGSPSAQVNIAGQAVTLSGTFTRYNVTFTLPSVNGKTPGTNNDHSTWLNFWYSSGSTNATNSGSVGVQSGTIWLWGVQIEIGSAMTPLEKPDPRYDLANCQRFYTGSLTNISYNQNALAGGIYFLQVFFPTAMRAAPTVVNPTYSAPTNITTSGWQGLSTTRAEFFMNATVAGLMGVVVTNVSFSADL